MEQIPNIRVVGSASEEEKEKAVDKVHKALFDHFSTLSPGEREDLEKLEYPKNNEQKVLIEYANNVTNALMERFGIEGYDVPLENFHIVPPELYNKISKGMHGGAFAMTLRQGIILNAALFRDENVRFALATIHELLHLKAHLSLEAKERQGGGHTRTVYRQGVSVYSAQKHDIDRTIHEHFKGLHEAIVAEAEKRNIPQVYQLPIMAVEKVWWESEEAENRKKELSKKTGFDIDEISYIGKQKNEKGGFDYDIVGYKGARKVLMYVCREIQETLSEKYESSEEVYDTFLRAHFTGNLLEIAREVEYTFG